MAIISRVGSSSLEGAKRIDAEYYQPRFLDLMATQAKCPYSKRPLARLCSKIDVGFVGPMAHAYTESGVPLLQTQNVKEFVLGFERLIYIQEWFHHLLRKSQVFKGDILIARSGSIGKAALVLERDPQPLNSSDIIIIRPTAVKATLLCTYLNCKFGQAQIERMSSGGLQGHINLGSLETLQVPIFGSELTTMVESKVLAGVDLISEAQANYTEAERLLLSELGLLDWKPARTLTFVGSYRDAARAQRTDAEYFHPKFKEMLDKVPQQIKFDRLGRLTTYKKGVEVGSSAYTDSGIPFWRVSNLSSHGLDDSNANFINQELYENLRQDYEPQQGEILLSKDATPGIAYYLEYPTQGIISSGILRLVIADAIPPHYLEIVLNSLFVQIQIEQDAGGSIIKHWKPSKVSKTLIPRLSDDKEKEIANLVQRSHAARREAKALFEKAKRAVEIAIEESEERAIEFIG